MGVTYSNNKVQYIRHQMSIYNEHTTLPSWTYYDTVGVTAHILLLLFLRFD